MANYATLKAAVNAAIKLNNNQEITGTVLQAQLLNMIDSLGAGYQFAGVATPSTDPGTPDENSFWIAPPGTYTNFSSHVVADGYIGIFAYNGSWTLTDISVKDGPATLFAVCDTAADTAAKTVTVSNFVRTVGAQVRVKFTYANSAASPTLNVNDTGAAPIHYYNAAASASNSWKAGETVLFFWDGTNWQGSNAVPDDISPAEAGDYDKDAAIEKLVDTEGNTVYPQTAVEGVFDAYGLPMEGFSPRMDSDTPTESITGIVRYVANSYACALEGVNVYRIRLSFASLSDTDADNLSVLLASTSADPSATAVFTHNFTAADKTKIKDDGYCDIFYVAVTATNYLHLKFGTGYLPTQTDIVIEVFTLEDIREVVGKILSGAYNDAVPTRGSARPVKSGGVYDTTVYNQPISSAAFTMTERYVSDVRLHFLAGYEYAVGIRVSGLSATDIEHLLYFRTALNDSAVDRVWSHTFTADEIAALKSDGECVLDYVPTVDTDYIQIFFTSGYTPTSGNQFTVSASYEMRISEAIQKINAGFFADHVPVKNSDNLITSDAVYEATIVEVNEGSVSFVMTGRFNNSNYLPLKKDRSYMLLFSVAGLSDTDIDNLSIFRVATGQLAGDWVFSHNFTAEEKVALKADGHIEIAYDASVDTSYIHLYFVLNYSPSTDQNVITVDATTVMSVKDAIHEDETPTENWLKGKTVVLFGDSITEFAGRGEGVEPKRYSDYLEEYLGVTCINVGIGGTCLRERHDPVIVEPGVYHISDYAALDIINMVRAACGVMYDVNTSYLELAQYAANQIKLYKDTHDDNTPQVARLAAIDWSKVDFVTFLAGTNDWHGGASLGDSGNTDTTTTLGAVNEIIRILLTTYPHLKILWFTPTVRWIDYVGTEESRDPAKFSDNYEIHGLTLKDFSKAIYDEVVLNHVIIADFYNQMGWNMYNFAEYFGDNATHPFRGNAYIGRKMANFFHSY